MADLDELDDIEPDDQDEDRTPAWYRKDLARRAKDDAAKTAENATLKRELAFMKAGVDTDSKLGAMFAKGYDGDMTADAVKAAWTDLSPQEPTPVPDPTHEPDMAARAAAQQLRDGATTPPTPDGRDKAFRDAKALRDGGMKAEDVTVAFLRGLVENTAQG